MCSGNNERIPYKKFISKLSLNLSNLSPPVTIPVILGILAFIAAAATVTGYMVWKNRTPPLPLTDPQYQNIGAEDCTGENPLYKPPTSSFKNPTYGKW